MRDKRTPTDVCEEASSHAEVLLNSFLAKVGIAALN